MVVVKCPRCGYSWVTRSTRRYVTCPNCYRKFPNPRWATTGTTTTTTSTTTGTGTTTTTRSPSEIAVWITDLPGEAYRDLRELAEEVSSPDPCGVEVLVLDSGIAEEVLRAHGIVLEGEVIR